MPLTLEGFGSYFAGGRQVVVSGQPSQRIKLSPQAVIEHDPNGTFHVEQAYVQWFAPAGSTARPPLVLVHGGCLTGASWETTPDGRPGWLDRFLRAGFAVHVVDGVERGRAGWCALPGIWPEAPVARSAEQIWDFYRLGPPDGFAARRGYPGQRFPLAALDTLICQHVPRWFSTIQAAAEALIAVLERVAGQGCPPVVLCHSNGGLIVTQAAWGRPDLLGGVVAVEGSGFPESPPPTGLAGKPFLFVMGDYLEEAALWRGLSAATSAVAGRLKAAGARVTDWRLPTLGIRGNSHLPMMDDNSDDIAARVIGWIEAEVR